MSICAQRKILKEVDFNNQNIELEFEDVDLIEIEHTDQQKLSISMQDYAENPSLLDIDSNENNIRIVSKKITPFQPVSKIDKYCYEQPLFPSYKLTIPEGCSVEIDYNNGNMNVQNFSGSMKLRLNTGDVTIHEFNGTITTELFSGNINATIKDTKAILVSNHGIISTTFPSTDWEKKDISLIGSLGNDNNLLKVQSIHANIILNTIETQ